MARVDAHCHLWQLARGDYAWLDGGPPALDSLRRDFLLGDLEPLLDAAGIERVVLVQAAATEGWRPTPIRPCGALVLNSV